MSERVVSTYSTQQPPEDVARRKRKRDWVLWAVLLGVPILWLGHLQLVLSIALWSHRTHKTWPMHIGVIASLLLSLAAGLIAWRTYRRAIGDETPKLEEVEEERVRFTMHLATWSVALFVLGLVAQWVAVFMIDPRID